MIRKGTPLSRFVALAVLFGPLVVLVVAFAIWAVTAWRSAGDRIEAATAALHRIDARRSQAELYGPLGASWIEYAEAAGSGLVLDDDLDAATRALVERVEGLFSRVEGGDGAVAVLGVEPAGDGLEVIRAEAAGALPQAALPRFFASLESGEPFLFVEFLEMRRAPESGQAIIELRLRFAAYRLTGARPAVGDGE